jgi:hypothetical protein
MDRCWLKGSQGDALHAVLCAAGFNIRWLLCAIVRLGLAGLFLRLDAAGPHRSSRQPRLGDWRSVVVVARATSTPDHSRGVRMNFAGPTNERSATQVRIPAK